MLRFAQVVVFLIGLKLLVMSWLAFLAGGHQPTRAAMSGSYVGGVVLFALSAGFFVWAGKIGKAAKNAKADRPSLMDMPPQK